jgi:hypothetical protein
MRLTCAHTAHFLPNTHTHINLKSCYSLLKQTKPRAKAKVVQRSGRGAWRPAHSANGASPALDVNAARRVTQVRGDALTFSLARNELTSEAHDSKSKSVWDAKAQQSRCILRFMRRVHLHCTHLMTLYHGLCSRLSPPQKPPTTIVYSYKLFKCNL